MNLLKSLLPNSTLRIEHKEGKTEIIGLDAWHSFWRDPYHLLLTIPLPLLILLVSILYVAINSFFAGLLLLVPSSIGGVDSPSFFDAFFFSVQTFASIGYGVMHPKTFYAHVIVTLEALVSLFVLALVTGLSFARFTKTTARVLFSKVAVINIHNGIQTLTFRAANKRRNQILGANLHVFLMRNEVSTEGDFMRRLYELKLERNYSPVFTVGWTVMHRIDKDSPLYECSTESLIEKEAQLLISLSGIDQTITNNIHAHHAYSAKEVLFNSKFVDIVFKTEDGYSYIDYTKFHDTERVS